MSADEDNELRELVSDTLEKNGVLSKIRAQLRASVFLALEEQSSQEAKTPLVNKELKEFLNSNDGRIVACLIREFLDYFNLVFTQSVFAPETGESAKSNWYKYDGRKKLSAELDIDNFKNSNGPILVEVLRNSRLNALNANKELTTNNFNFARENFVNHDKDKNGTIDKDSTCDVFMDIFPNFRRSLVEKYVSEEFQSLQKKFREEINFDEFSTMYQKLFDLCRSVVEQDTSLFLPSNKNTKNFESEIIENPLEDVEGHFGVNNDKLLSPKMNTVNNFVNEDENNLHDPFFDDSPSPTLSSPKTKPNFKEKQDLGSRSSLRNENNSFLDSLPALVTTTRGGNHESGRDSPLLSKLDQDINAKLAEIGLNASNDDYDDDDFQSSGQKSGSEASIDEEIEGDTSAYADLLCSTASGVSLPGNENITTDKTVSQMSASGIDYLESLQHDSGDRI